MSRLRSVVAVTTSLIAACHLGDSPPSAPIGPLNPLTTRAVASIPLAVTVNDVATTGVYRVLSDGLGEYVDGRQGIGAEIDGYGNLILGPLTIGPQTRSLRFDFSAPVDPLNAYRPDTSGQQLFSIKTNPNLVDGTRSPKIGDLGLNGNPASACYSAGMAFRNVTTQYVAVFNQAAAPQSAQVYITRTGIAPATWTMVSDGSCSGNANSAGLTSQDLSTKKPSPQVFHGYFDLRFSIVLRGL